MPNSTFTLNGQVYKYTEDTSHNILTITGTKSYLISAPELTFKLDSSLLFTLAIGAPATGTYPGTVKPIATVTATGRDAQRIRRYARIRQLRLLPVQERHVHAGEVRRHLRCGAEVVHGLRGQPGGAQQQLAVFDLNGTTYMVTDGTTAGAATPAGINPGTMWSQTSNTTSEAQFGLVYGFAAQPTYVIAIVQAVSFSSWSPMPTITPPSTTSCTLPAATPTW